MSPLSIKLLADLAKQHDVAGIFDEIRRHSPRHSTPGSVVTPLDISLQFSAETVPKLPGNPKPAAILPTLRWHPNAG